MRACGLPLGGGGGGLPADGVGATLTVRIGGQTPIRPSWVNFDRDVTLGHIVRPADDTQGAAFSGNEWKSALLIRWDNLLQDEADDFAPINTSARKSRVPLTNKLTMDSGDPSQAATIQHLVPAEAIAGKRFGLFIEPPLCLKSDLYLKYIGPSDATYGTGWRSNSLGSFADGAIYLTGGISEGVSGRGVTIDNPVYEVGGSSVYTPVFLGGVSTFTGPLTIASGMLRLLGDGRFEGDSHALGTNNSVCATSGSGVLDLAGTRAGLDGNTLHLGGFPARAELGTLVNSNPDPLVPGEWAGAIVIDAATRLGGYSQMPSGAELGGGDIVLSGPVSGSADVDLANRREVVLAGDNTDFSGNWNLTDGFLRLRGANPVGTGTLNFLNTSVNPYGAAYRFGAADDTDLSTVAYNVSNRNVRIDVADGLTYRPAWGFKGLAVENTNAQLVKSGRGTLCLSEPNVYTGTRANYDWNTWLAVADGTVVLDYTENHGAKLVGASADNTVSRSGTVRLGERVTLEVKGTPDDGIGFWQYLLAPGAFATVRFDADGASAGKGYWFARGKIATDGVAKGLQGGVLNIEADPAKWKLRTNTEDASAYVGEKVAHDADYPSIRSPGELWNGTTFTCRDGEALVPVADTAYATDFATVSAGATTAANSLVDVTPTLAAQGPHANVACAALRFNTPNGGQPLVLELDGTAQIGAGAILVTPNMGDTPVVIRGGQIARKSSVDTLSQIYILNFNTNATLTIESDLGDGSGALLVAGPGRTVFTGRYLSSGAIAVNGGRLSVGDGAKLLASVRATDADGSRTWCFFRDLHLYGGGLLELTEDAAWTAAVANEAVGGNSVTNGWRPHYGVSGGGFSVAAGKTFTVAAPGWTVNECVQCGARFVKDGAGTLSYAQAKTVNIDEACLGTGGKLSAWIYRYDLRGGTVGRFETPADNGLDPARVYFGKRGAVILTAQDGTTVVGREYSTTRLADANRPSVDAGNAVRIVIPRGATLTHDRHATASALPGELTFSAINAIPTGLRAGGLFAGAGTLVLTNSQGRAGIQWGGFRNRLFSGTILDRCGLGDATRADQWRYTGYAAAFERASLTLPDGIGWYLGFGQDGHAILPMRLGGLDGAGRFEVVEANLNNWTSPRLGCDDGRTHDFAGYLQITRNGGGYGQLVKVGSNVQRMSGATNELQTSARVVDGTLVLGSLTALDSQTLLARGFHNNVYVGGAETTAGMAPRFLVDCGNVTVTNVVKVLGCADAGVSPGVGAQAGAVTFAELVVSNDCTLVAEAGATARFAKITQLDGPHAFGRRGAGTVTLADDFTVGGSLDLAWDGGLFVVEGVLTVADGTKLSVAVPSELDASRRYTLIRATGGIEGRFDFSGVSVPKGWRLRQRAKSVVLVPERGVALIIR